MAARISRLRSRSRIREHSTCRGTGKWISSAAMARVPASGTNPFAPTIRTIISRIICPAPSRFRTLMLWISESLFARDIAPATHRDRRQRPLMSGYATRSGFVSSVAATLFVFGFNPDVAAQTGDVPILQNGPWLWEHPFGGVFPPVKGAALPVQQDPSRPFVPGRAWHIPDLSNPNLKDWAKSIMKKEVEEIDRGKLQLSASSSCFPTGVPDFFSDGGPYLIVQAP